MFSFRPYHFGPATVVAAAPLGAVIAVAVVYRTYVCVIVCVCCENVCVIVDCVPCVRAINYLSNLCLQYSSYTKHKVAVSIRASTHKAKRPKQTHGVPMQHWEKCVIYCINDLYS